MMWTIPIHVRPAQLEEEVPTLTLVVHAKVGETELLDVILEGSALGPTVRLADEGRDGLEVFPGYSTSHQLAIPM